LFHLDFDNINVTIVVKSAKNERAVLPRNKRNLVCPSFVVILYGFDNPKLQFKPLPKIAGDIFKKPNYYQKENIVKILIIKKKERIFFHTD